MFNNVQSYHQRTPLANVCLHVDETVPKILLESTSLQFFSYTTTGRQKSSVAGKP